MNVKLVAAKEDDFEFAWQIYSESVSPLMKNHLKNGWNDDEQKKQFKTIFDVGNTKLIYANDIKIGWVDFMVEKDRIRLTNGYLLPAHRRKGIGSKVMEMVKNMGEGTKIIEMSILKNSPHRPFFDKFGFQEEHESNITHKLTLK